MHTKRRSMVSLPFIAALLGPAVHAAPEPQTVAPPANAVVVSGMTRGLADRDAIVAATDPLLWPGSASSCGFMAPYNPNYDPVTVAYMADFGMLGSRSFEEFQLSESAPFGDASMPLEDTGRDRLGRGRLGRGGVRAGTLRRGAIGGCSGADLRFAAGRMHIAMHDKSLGLAFQAFARKDYVRARELFTEAWNKVGYRGVPALMVARLHLYGLGTPQDTRAAVDWLDKVANDRFGPGMAMRFNPAQPAAMSPMAEAAWMLAQIYDHGIGIAPDPALARKWYAKAAEYGYVPALDVLAMQDLAPGAGAERREQAVGRLKQAAEAGYAPAQYHLARAYYNGDGAPRDLRLAGAWFDAAAHAGVPAAQFAAGRMIDLGEGAPADPRKALVYYKDAALKGDRDAEFALGTYFYSGEVLAKDTATARKWFAAAARQGQPDAMFNLGLMTARGEGGGKDPAMGYVWLALAAQSGQQQAGAARDLLAPNLNPQERERAEAVLQPKVASN
jgi:TPR repeat protein